MAGYSDKIVRQHVLTGHLGCLTQILRYECQSAIRHEVEAIAEL